MAYVTNDRALGRSASLLQDLKATFVQRLAQIRAYRTTRDELAALSDRELRDLGVSRFDIDAVAREAARLV